MTRTLSCWQRDPLEGSRWDGLQEQLACLQQRTACKPLLQASLRALSPLSSSCHQDPQSLRQFYKMESPSMARQRVSQYINLLKRSASSLNFGKILVHLRTSLKMSG